MITRELVKAQIDKVEGKYLEVLYKIIKALIGPSDLADTTPAAAEEPETLGGPPNFFEETAGAWQDAPLVREEPGNYEAGMALTLDVPQKLEQELSNEAIQLGLTLSEYVLRLLSLRQALKIRPQTGAELAAYWREAGLVGTRPDIDDSQQHARMLRAEAEKRNPDNSSS